MKLILALVVAAAAGPSLLKMASPMDSQIRFGNAVLNSHCVDDEAPVLNGITTTNDQSFATQHFDEMDGKVKAHIAGVRMSCAGLLGTKPCASDANYAHPKFYCEYTNNHGDTIPSSGPHNAVRETDGSYGVSTSITCDAPAVDAKHQDVTVTVVHKTGLKKTTFKFVGEPGMNKLGVTTGSPTPAPTRYPTKAGFANCWAAKQAGQPTGITKIYIEGTVRDIYCDQGTDGGGWALVSMIDKDSTAHSNKASVGCKTSGVASSGDYSWNGNVGQCGTSSNTCGVSFTADRHQWEGRSHQSCTITPSTSGVMKYADEWINALKGHAPAPKNAIKFECVGITTGFFPNTCAWSATEGLDEQNNNFAQASTRVHNERACINAYRNNGDQNSQLSSQVCNSGSQGVGAHCGGNLSGDYNRHRGTEKATYCSHCPNGESPYESSAKCRHRDGNSKRRCGCWVDSYHYKENGHWSGRGSDGKVWVR